MRLVILAALAAVAISPAEACHVFSVWRYPFRQRCAAEHWTPRAAVRVVAIVSAPVDPTAPSAADIDRLRTAMVAAAKARVWP